MFVEVCIKVRLPELWRNVTDEIDSFFPVLCISFKLMSSKELIQRVFKESDMLQEHGRAGPRSASLMFDRNHDVLRAGKTGQ